MAKEKKFFWLKQKIDFFQDVRIKKLRKIAGGDTYVIIFQKIMLLSVPTNGIILFDEVEDSLSEELALILDEDEINVQVTLDFMHKYRMIESVDNNEFIVNSVLPLIGSETASAQRVRDKRERDRALQCNINVTECNADVTQCNTEKSIEELELKKSKSIVKEDYKEKYPTINENAFNEWMDYKKYKTKAPITKTINFLSKYSFEVQQQIVDTSIMNNYKGLFEPKQQNTKPTFEKNAQVAKTWLESQGINEQGIIDVK